MAQAATSFDGLFSCGTPSNKLVILDGGLGTTLEDHFHASYISHFPLWSSKVVVEDPDLLINAHLAFLRAGARVLSTATYQCSYATFERASYSHEEAKRIMLKSVELADQARSLFYQEQDPSDNSCTTMPQVWIALSLGPYGAMVVPTQEFNGVYPPPYGPQAFSSISDNCNSYPVHDKEAYDDSVEALTQFHLERFRIFMEHPNIWAKIDCLAFETVPLAREIRAIRRAVTIAFSDQSPAAEVKPWWVSCVFPDGRFPETVHPGGSNLTVHEIAQALFGGLSSVHLHKPTAVGINCTMASYALTLVEEFARAVKSFAGLAERKPWLVLYPNGGDVYDPVSREWNQQESSQKSAVWVDLVTKVVRTVANTESGEPQLWSGLIVGGCCRVGPSEIKALVTVLTK